MSLEASDFHIQAEKLLRLGQDWNCYEAEPPKREAVEAALACLNAAWLVPMVDGGVQVALRAGEVEVELDFHPDGTVGFGVWGGGK